METTLEPEKQLHRVHGVLVLDNTSVHGYEIHMGVSRGPALMRPAVRLAGRDDGAISADGQIIGTYLHGLFESPAACASLLSWAGLQQAESLDYAAIREANIERLADAIEAHIDLRMLEESLGCRMQNVECR
ncbi:MAG: cobyric acid synthase, partial [Acidiferrobacterales bacterium]